MYINDGCQPYSLIRVYVCVCNLFVHFCVYTRVSVCLSFRVLLCVNGFMCVIYATHSTAL